uniref:Uncharacterized protein n=1 Tax=Anopheles stephensi TaxID=30069 RepID=A0A182YN44_ANOST
MYHHRFTVRRFIALLVLYCCLEAACTERVAPATESVLADISPLTDALQGHVEKFKKLRDDLKALQNSKDSNNPLHFFRETMRIMEGLTSLGKDWKTIERLQNNPNREFETLLEEMDPVCGQRSPRTPFFEIKLRCSYTDLGGKPYYRIGPLKQEQLNLTPFTVTVYRDFLTPNEVKRANETRQIDPNVRRRLHTIVPNLFNVAVRAISQKGYNGSNVKHRGYSMMVYLESYINAGMTLFQGGTFTVAPTSGSVLVSRAHPSICPSGNSVNVITNFNVLSKKK